MFQNIHSQPNTNHMTEISKRAQGGLTHTGHNGARLIVFCGPSGGGKTTQAKMLVNSSHLNYALSISYTTRELRPGERDGVDYFKIDVETFLSMERNGQFIEHQEVYEKTFYGTSRNVIAQIICVDKIAVLDVDVKGAMKIKKSYGESAFVFFITPDQDDAIAIDMLKERIMKRDGKVSNERLERASFELSNKRSFDCLLVNTNGGQEETSQKVREILEASFLNKVM